MLPIACAVLSWGGVIAEVTGAATMILSASDIAGRCAHRRGRCRRRSGVRAVIFGSSASGQGTAMMMAPGKWSHRGMRAYSDVASGGFRHMARGTDRADRQPDQNQRKAFEEFRAASDKAAQMVSAACPVEVPQTVSGRLALMEARMTLMLDAVKVIRPAFDAFYATLTPDQKVRLDASRPHRWFWDRWRT